MCKCLIGDLGFYQVHMEVDRKAMPGDVNMLAGPHVQEKITYKAGSKVIILEVFVDRRWFNGAAISSA